MGALVMKLLSGKVIKAYAKESPTSRGSIHRKPQSEWTTFKSYHTSYLGSQVD